MIDENIKRFCNVVRDINEINDQLDSDRSAFYDGGTPFEKVYEAEIQELTELQNVFDELFSTISKRINHV